MFPFRLLIKEQFTFTNAWEMVSKAEKRFQVDQMGVDLDFLLPILGMLTMMDLWILLWELLLSNKEQSIFTKGQRILISQVKTFCQIIPA